MDAPRLQALLSESGWQARPSDTPGTFECGFGGIEGSFSARVHLGDEHLEIVVGPYVVVAAERTAALHARLLTLNASIVMARFSISDAGAVFLRVDWPRANLDDSEVRDALDAASYYADRHWAEIQDFA